MNPDREALITILAVIGMSGLLFSILMMIATTVYLNKSPDRFRIFELGYSKESEWYKTGKVDFFTANYIICLMPLAALRMRSGWGAAKARLHGTPLAPYLHLDNNYEKFLLEFPKFVIWEIVTLSVTAVFILIIAIGYGMDANWW